MYIPKLFAFKSEITAQIIELADKSLRGLGEPVTEELQYDELILCAGEVVMTAYRSSLEMDINEKVEEILAIDGEPDADSPASLADFWGQLRPAVIDPVLEAMGEKTIDTVAFQPWTPSGLRELATYLARRLRNYQIAAIGPVEAARLMEFAPEDVRSLGVTEGQHPVEPASPPPVLADHYAGNPPPPPLTPPVLSSVKSGPKGLETVPTPAAEPKKRGRPAKISPHEDDETPGSVEAAKANDVWTLFRKLVVVDREALAKSCGVSQSSISNFMNGKGGNARLTQDMLAALQLEVTSRKEAMDALVEKLAVNA